MAEIHRIPNMAAAERAALEWIVRLHADDVSVEDRQRFEQWRDASPVHARAYGAVTSTWTKLLKTGPLVRAVSFGQAMNAASSAPAKVRRWAVGALAASSVIACLISAAYWSQPKAGMLFQTAIGEHATVSLPDGSSLELNSNSSARVDFRRDARVIQLERGEAFFQVAHDVHRPFWVVADRYWVRAVGTAFNVYKRAADVEVTVSEGTIRVGALRALHETPSDTALGQDSVSVLSAGEQADVNTHTAVIRALKPTQLKRSVAWREGNLYFENQRLGDVIDEMSRYTTLKITINDPSLRNLPVAGTFRANPDGADALLDMLQEGLGLKVSRDGQEKVLIQPRPSE